MCIRDRGEAAPSPAHAPQSPCAKAKLFPSGITAASKDPGWDTTQSPPLTGVTSTRCLNSYPPYPHHHQSWSLHLTLETSLPSEATDMETMAEEGWEGKKVRKCQVLDGCTLNSVFSTAFKCLQAD